MKEYTLKKNLDLQDPVIGGTNIMFNVKVMLYGKWFLQDTP